jgi:hypothetical protein
MRLRDTRLHAFRWNLEDPKNTNDDILIIAKKPYEARLKVLEYSNSVLYRTIKLKDVSWNPISKRGMVD